MSVITLGAIAVGLAMDAFAVSIASGCADRNMKIGAAMKMALFFGAFQAGMPVLGWLAGIGMRSYIAAIDHWAAFGLLGAIGSKMIYESFKLNDQKKTLDASNLYILLMLSVATSIDALAVGFSLSCIRIAIVAPAIVIGVVTFVFSVLGVYFGKRFGHLFEHKIELAGGIILIAIGIKIVIEHTIA